MKKILVALVLGLFVLLMNSCVYYCYFSAIGSAPQNKSYYILPNDSNLIGDLEFERYAKMLTTVLNRAGYNNVPAEKASIIIYFNWQIGELSTESVSKSYTYNSYSSATSTQWVTTPYGYSYPQTTFTTVTTPRTGYIAYDNDYSPITIQVIAVDKQTRKQIWKTTINDKLEYNKTTLNKLLPVMLYAGSKYFGTTAEGLVDLFPSEINQNGIMWPY